MAATVVLVGLGENSVALRHELTHAIAFNAWGPPRDGAPWLAEGLATWVAGDCAGQPIHDLARDRRARSESIPLQDLLHDFARQNDIVSYLQSGSLIGYILATYGADALEHVWRDGEDGLHAIGVDEARLERDWLRFIDARPAARMDWTAIREHGCG